MWRDTLTHMTHLAAAFEECINSLELILRQQPLSRHKILRTWDEINLVPNTTIGRKFSRYLLREHVCILLINVEDRVTRLTQRLP